MPSFRHEQDNLLEQKLEGLEQLSANYSDAILAVSHGDVDVASEKVQGAEEILAQIDAWQKASEEDTELTKGDEAQERLRAKARAVLDLHSHLVEALSQERDEVARQQKELSQGRRHLESLQPQGQSGRILDSQA